MNKILITGANGQLGTALQKFSKSLSDSEFIFTDQDELDITDANQVAQFFNTYKPDFCINCAAYTAVDKAEIEPDLAFKINKEGVENLANESKNQGAVLIQISTDFVFDGNTNRTYKETDAPNPINVYGKSKYEAEQIISDILENYFIIRTAWVYSEFGNNFFKTMIRLGREKDEIKVVSDQFGTPTYACDLAKFILAVVASGKKQYGIYHFTNQGVTTWFEFAKQILKLYKPEVKVIPINSEDYQSAAKRPVNSALDLNKTMQTFNAQIPEWQESVNECMRQHRLYDKESWLT